MVFYKTVGACGGKQVFGGKTVTRQQPIKSLCQDDIHSFWREKTFKGRNQSNLIVKTISIVFSWITAIRPHQLSYLFVKTIAIVLQLDSSH